MDFEVEAAHSGRRPARFGTALGVAVAALAVGLVAAPVASATATRVGADADINYGLGTNYGTGCQYTVEVSVTDPVQPVHIFDNGASIGWFRPNGGQAVAPWTPATVGNHRLTAVQTGTPAGAPTPYVNVRVGTGTHIGTSCAVTG
ncbi:hypothetical protein [Nocardia alni]|uniref:hypothetical protein n=1 Tax=Nocardia alni TaxID=2815723 RepID=UPI001C22565A|nr:hypothetical protein [Nocardia alni]